MSIQYQIVPYKKPWRWIGLGFSIFILFTVLQSVFFNDKWGWAVFRHWFFDPAILDGLLITLKLTFSAMVLSFIFGGVVAMMRLSSSWLVKSLAWGYIWLFRSLPLLVVLIILYNFSYLYESISLSIPFTHISYGHYKTVNVLDQFMTALIGLTIVQSAYTAEVIRGGIQAVDRGQVEASMALGLSWWHRTTRIIFPQAIRSILPAIINECINLSKGTAIVYVLAMPELFYTVQMIYNRNQDVIPLLMVAAVWYTVITSIFSVAQYAIERKLQQTSKVPVFNFKPFVLFKRTPPIHSALIREKS
ncbi:amino acid ABC transporter permease [Acinetobacter nectaris]|uniref:amino acid ABC transporter permease n=1 Tax=Acinetobacter nectaris TaxID=1219382 RepID=UPI001F34037E|nr:amino acid ABC transporter permease [Acinetobacter nectaris]MCF9047213.1 amino acid ABC transporter permease [Acinetobacter nectaris]